MLALLTASAKITLQPIDYLVFYVLPVTGVALLLFCFICVVKGYKLTQARQVIKGFGLDMEISILSVFLILSALMLGVGVLVHLRTQELAKLRSTIENLNLQLERTGRFSVRLIIAPPKDKSTWGDLDKLVCYYTLYSDGKEVEAQVSRGPAAGSLQIYLADITRADIIQMLQLRQRGSQMPIATAENIYVLQPTVHLTSAAR